LVSWLTAAIVIAAVFGLNIGSFLNVVIWRLPRGGSLTTPTWSYCPRCEHRLGGWDLIPVLSFLALRARCRYCRNPISWRYPGIEALTAVLFAAVAWRFSGAEDFGAEIDILFGCLFVSVLVCVFFIDLEHFVIPDGLNLTGFFIGLAHWGAISLWVGRVHPLRSSLFGGLSYAGILYGIGLIAYVVLVGIGGRKGFWRSGWNYLRENAADWAWITVYSLGTIIPSLRRYAEPPQPLEGFTAAEIEADEDEGGLGGGDPKLALGLGANLLWPLWLQSLAYAILLGALQSIVVLIVTRRRLGQKTAIPFGPALVGGALVALFFGHDIWAWYVQHYLSFPGSPFVPGGGVGTSR
jgi:prepilin signal peptidase PulO-like enzyme (type II secretory pathway)